MYNLRKNISKKEFHTAYLLEIRGCEYSICAKMSMSDGTGSMLYVN